MVNLMWGVLFSSALYYFRVRVPVTPKPMKVSFLGLGFSRSAIPFQGLFLLSRIHEVIFLQIFNQYHVHSCTCGQKVLQITFLWHIII